jgi:cell division protein FtsL
MMTRWLPMWVVPVLLVLAVSSVWLRLSIVRTTYEIDQTSKMIRNTQQDLERLELNVARLKSPRHLEMLARKKFGLNPPQSDQVIRLQD